MEERESSMARVVGLLYGVISWQRDFFFCLSNIKAKMPKQKRSNKPCFACN